jgi:hypothetical protein
MLKKARAGCGQVILSFLDKSKRDILYLNIYNFLSMRLLYNKAFLIFFFVILTFGMTGCTREEKAMSDTPANAGSIIITEDALEVSATRDD